MPWPLQRGPCNEAVEHLLAAPVEKIALPRKVCLSCGHEFTKEDTVSTKPLLAPLAILLGALCSSTSGTAQALAPPDATSYAIGGIRLLGGGLLLLLWGVLRGSLPSLRTMPMRLLLPGAAGLVGFQLCFFQGCKLTGVAVCTIIAIGGTPPLAGALSWLVLGERVTRHWWIATAIALAGLVTLTASGKTEVNFDVTGIFLGVGAAASYAVNLVSTKSLVRNNDPTHIITAVLLLGGLVMLPLLCLQPLEWMLTPRGLLVVADLAILTTSLSFTLVLYGMQFTPVPIASTLCLAEPLGAALLGIFLLKEPVNALTLLGIALIVASMLVLIVPQLRQMRAVPHAPPSGS